MGTSYTVLEKDGLTIELDEMSNTFSLSLDAQYPSSVGVEIYETRPGTAGLYTYRPQLTPADVIGMGLEMLKVASYWMLDDEFNRAIENFIEKEGGKRSYMATYLRSVGASANV